jgi:hypothetical protein
VTTTDPVSTEKTVNPRFWMDERSVDTPSQKLTVPLQLKLDSVSDGQVSKSTWESARGSLQSQDGNCRFAWNFGSKATERPGDSFQRSTR